MAEVPLSRGVQGCVYTSSMKVIPQSIAIAKGGLPVITRTIAWPFDPIEL
ncbi:hypothetical protein [Pontibacter ruber]|uniref:Uncharacterized protein n=1 Tax=Pontibacter ruber TaxID=1343895 RepID=A0ABW5CVS3_9BACT